jgi:uncharacterized membrane protein YqhA
MDDTLPAREHTVIERLVEQTIFASRWLLAPFYVGMIVSLLVLLLSLCSRLTLIGVS